MNEALARATTAFSGKSARIAFLLLAALLAAGTAQAASRVPPYSASVCSSTEATPDQPSLIRRFIPDATPTVFTSCFKVSPTGSDVLEVDLPGNLTVELLKDGSPIKPTASEIDTYLWSADKGRLILPLGVSACFEFRIEIASGPAFVGLAIRHPSYMKIYYELTSLEGLSLRYSLNIGTKMEPELLSAEQKLTDLTGGL
jgi:hypothetical protein